MNRKKVISLTAARKRRKKELDNWLRNKEPIWDNETWAQRRKRAIPEVMNLMDIDEAEARELVKWCEKELKKKVDPVTADPKYIEFRFKIQTLFMNENEKARWQQYWKMVGRWLKIEA